MRRAVAIAAGSIRWSVRAAGGGAQATSIEISASGAGRAQPVAAPGGAPAVALTIAGAVMVVATSAAARLVYSEAIN